jgi:hypothetical protein
MGHATAEGKSEGRRGGWGYSVTYLRVHGGWAKASSRRDRKCRK